MFESRFNPNTGLNLIQVWWRDIADRQRFDETKTTFRLQLGDVSMMIG